MIVIAETFIASATVVVKADTTQLRKDLAALSAQSKKPIKVNVTANTAGFAKDLNQKIAAAKKQVVQVPVTPNMTGFLGKLRTEIKAAADKVVARVRVEPNMAGFQGRLQTAVSAAASKVTAKVAVTPVGGVAPAGGTKQTGGTGGGVSRAATAEQELAKAQTAGAFARKKVIGDLSIEEKRAQSLERELAFLTAAEKARSKALIEQNGPALAAATALKAEAEAAVAKRQATIGKATARAEAPARASAARMGAIQSAALEENAARDALAKADQLRRTEEANVFEALEKEKTAAVKAAETQRTQIFIQAEAAREAERKAASARAIADVKAFNAAEAEAARQRAAINKKADKISAATSTQVSRAEKVPPRILGAAQAEAIKQEERLQKARDASAAATTRLGNAEKFVSAESNTVTAARQALSQAQSAETVALNAFNRALKGKQVSLKNDTSETYANARALTVQRNEQLAAAEAAVAGQKKLSFRLRGFGAQIATFGGLRGAVLAANAQFIAGTVAAIAFGKAVASVAALESELNVFKVTTGATADEMVRVSNAAQALGTDISLPAVTAGSAAEAMTELAKAGLSVEDSIAGARGTLQLATAAQIDNATATQIAASALNAFSLAGSDAVHVADVLTNAANASQGSIADMGIALQQSAAVARQVGISFEDTVSFLTLLSRAGIKGSDAGTSLRVAFTRLINPTDKAQKIIGELGVKLRDAQGNIRPQVFTDFAAAQANLSKSQQDANAAVVFGTDALRAYSIIARAGTPGFNQVSAALDKQGSAAELANARMAGLTGAAENLKNQLSGLGLTVGTLVKGPLEALATNLATIISLLNTSVGGVLKFGTSLKSAFDKINKEVNDFATVNIKGLEIGPKTFFDPSNPLKAATEGLKAVQSVTKNASGEIFVARARIAGLISDLNKVGGLTNINKTVVDLQKLQARLQGGDEQSQKFADDIGVFIKQLQKVSANPKIDPFKLSIEIPPELLSGEPGKVAADASVKAFQSTLSKSQTANAKALFDSLFGGFSDQLAGSVALFVAPFAQFGAKAKEAFINSIRLTTAEANAITNQLSAAASKALEIQAAGGPNVQQSLLANAKQAEAAARQLVKVRQKAIQAVLLSPTGNKNQLAKAKKELDAANQAVIDAVNDQKSARDAITSVQQQAAADAKAKSDKVKKAASDADQAFIDSFAPAERRLDLAAARAAGTPRITDDLKNLVARRKLLNNQIAAILNGGIKDQKLAAQMVADKRVEIQNITNDINDKLDQINQISFEVSPVLQAQINLAQAEGNIPLQIKLIDRQIANINKLIEKEHLLGVALNNAKTAREELRKQREDLQNQQIQDQIALAQSIFDLTGNRNPLLKALNVAVAETRADIKAAKAAGKSTTVLQTELNDFLKQRKELLGDMKDATQQGLTVFELLKQNVDTFNAVGGNLIQGNQPFPGPTGFTADVAQFLVASKKKPTNLTPAAGGKTKFELNDDRLVRAMDRLTEAVLHGTSGNQTATTQATVVGQRWTAIGKFWEAHSALRYQDANNG